MRASTISGLQGYWNDFIHWEGPLASGNVAGWIVTSTEAGAGATVLNVRDSAQFGILRILTDAADNDRAQLQLDGSSFRYVVGKRLWCFARLALQTPNDGEAGFGLIIESDTDMLNTDPTDGIYFRKAETATDFTFVVRKNDVETTQVGGLALVADTFVVIGFTVNAAGGITAYFNSLTAGTAVANTNAVDDEDLTLALEIQTGDATTRYMDVDWVIVCQER